MIGLKFTSIVVAIAGAVIVIALFFLSFLLLQGPPRGAISMDRPEVVAPTVANESFLR